MVIPYCSALRRAQVRRWDQGQIVAQSLKTGERTLLWEGGSDARFVPTGHLVYAVGDALFALAFDTNRLQVTGGPVSLVQGLARPANQGAATAAANYGISANGTLVYAAGARFTAGGGSVLNTLVWVNREGREELLSAPPRAYTYPRISPDGTKVALDIRDQQLDIWVWDIARETLTRLTFDPGEDEFPLWSSDSQRIVFSSTRGGGSTFKTSLFSVAANGTGPVEQLAEGAEQTFPGSFSADATQVVVFGSGTDGDDDIGVVSLKAVAADGNAVGKVRPLLHTTFGERNVNLSPDGRWMVYESDESGRFEIYVRPFPDVDGGRWQVSTGGGMQPAWARNGRELFYRNGAALLTVPVQTDPSFVVGTPKTLFENQYFTGPGGRAYDVSPDCRRLLLLKPAGGAQGTPPTPRLIIVENWFEELNRLVPVN